MFVFGYKTRSERVIRDAVCIALGALFLFFPESWFSGAAVLFGVKLAGLILVVLGGIEFFALLGAMAVTGVGFLPFALSIGSVVFGLSMLFSDGKFPIVKFLGGIALLWYGISDLISGWKIAKAIDEYEIKRTKEAPQQPSSDEFTATDLESAKEVDFRKED